MEDIQHTQGMLSNIFGIEPQAAEAVFHHPCEREILIQSIEILQKSETGAHLLGVLNEKDIGVKVIKNRNAHGYTPDMKNIFLGVPPEQEEADTFVVLELGGAVREIEQDIVGFKMPREDEDPLTAASIKHAKYLDIIVYLCKIAIELEKSTGSTEYVETLEKLGHGDVLQAYLAQAGDEEMISAYAKAHNKVQ